MEERRGANRVLVKKAERKRPLGRCRYRQDNIKMDLPRSGMDGAWTGLFRLRIGMGAGHLRGNKPLGSIKCRKFLD
jgi:hypothetical protein